MLVEILFLSGSLKKETATQIASVFNNSKSCHNIPCGFKKNKKQKHLQFIQIHYFIIGEIT